MAVEMEGLEFQIETTTGEAVKGVDALANTFRKFKTLTKGGLGLGSSVKQLEKLDAALKKFDTSKLEGIGKALESVSKLGEVKISGNVAKQLGSIADVMDRITLADIERLEDMAKALRDLGEVSNVKIPKIRVPASGTAVDVVTPTTGTAATSGMTQATSSVQEVSAAVTEVTQKTISFKSVLSGIGGVFKKGFSLGVGVLHKLGNAITKVAVAAGKAVKNLLGFNKTSAGTAAHVKHVTSGMGHLLSSFKRIAMYRLVRFALSAVTKALKEGVNNLYQYSAMMGGAFAVSMNSAATNALYLKNSLGAMAAPIVNALAPAIDYLSGKIVSLLNLINMLIARLTGSSTYTAAKKISASYGDAFDSAAGSAKEAADKIKSYTTGIDELNIIQETPDNGSGGGGGGGADYGSMFEEIPIDSKISDFADRLKEAFDNADWEAVGTLVGTKVNELIDSVDYSGIGKKIGFGINGAVQTAYYFLDTVDFNNIGRHVAELVNNALAEVDTSFIGKTIVKWFTLKWDFILGFLSELDWGQVASKLADGLKGAFDEATNWLSQYDWGQVGRDVWEKIKSAVTDADWGAVVSSLAKALGSALGGLVSLLGSFCKGVWEDISAYFTGKIEECGGDIPAGLWKGIKDAFGNAWDWIKTNIVDPFIEGFCSLFGIHSPSTVMEEIGKFITEGLLNGILAPFKAIGSWINTNIVQPLVQAFKESPVIEFTVGVVNGAKTWWKNVKDWWSGVSSKGVSLSAAVSLVKSGWSTVKGWIGNIPIVNQGISLIKSGWTTVKNWIGTLPVISQSISLLKSGWTTVKNWIGTLPVISQSISLVKSGWTTVKNWIGTLPTISQSISLIKSGWTTVKNWIGTLPVISQGISLVKSGWTTVKNWIGTIPVLSQGISLLKSGWTSVKNWIGTLPVISQGISLFKSGWSTISNWIGTTTHSVGVSLWKNGWSSISSWIGTSVSVGISLFKSGWSSIKSFFGLANGGIVGANGGVKAFSSGGSIHNGVADLWNAIPKYAGGTINAHGSMFVAGEKGAELVGHVNGRTEVLNKSQLGQVMHRSIVDGMAQFAGYWGAVNTHMSTCTNAMISAMLVSADAVYAGLDTRDAYMTQGVGEWMDNLGNRVEAALAGVGSTEQIAEGVREGMYEVTARQNDLLREQNELLQRLLNKNTTVQIGNKTIKDAVVTQENADGYRFTK